MNTARTSSEVRKTKETDIQLDPNIDGSGVYEVDTGIGFFDHMLEGFSRHGFFDLKLQVKGDLHVDSHHTIEDTGIVLGTAIKNALGKKKASAATEAVSCQWMRHLSSVPWIYREDLIFPLMELLIHHA